MYEDNFQDGYLYSNKYDVTSRHVFPNPDIASINW